MKKKVIVSGLFLIMLFCVASVANASIMTSDYINDYYAKVNAYSGGNLDISFNVQAPNTMDKLGVKTIILQELPVLPLGTPCIHLVIRMIPVC